MATETDTPPADSTDDDWWTAVNLLTGYAPPKRGTVFNGLVGNNGIPLMKIEISDSTADPSNAEADAINDLSWRNQNAGWRIDNTDFVVPFYSGMHGGVTDLAVGTQVKMRKARITMLGTNSDHSIPAGGVDPGAQFTESGSHLMPSDFNGWDSRPLGQYSYGGGLALEQLLNPPYSTQGWAWNGIDIDRKNAVDLTTFDRVASAFDRAAIFFLNGQSTMRSWETLLGSEDAAWRGKAAGVFWDIIHTLNKEYTNYSQSLPVAGAGQSVVGTQLRDARQNFTMAISNLHGTWSTWALFTGNPLRWLFDLLVEITDQIWYNNITKVRFKYAGRSGQNEVTFPGFHGDVPPYTGAPGPLPGFGMLDDLDTWKAIGEEAIRRWQQCVKDTLGAAAKQALIDVRNAFVSVPGQMQPLTTVTASLSQDLATDQSSASLDAQGQQSADAQAAANAAQAQQHADAEAALAEQKREFDIAQANAEKQQQEQQASQDQQQAKQEKLQQQQEKEQKQQYEQQRADQQHQEQVQQAQQARQEKLQEQQYAQQRADQQHQEKLQEQQQAQQRADQQHQEQVQQAQQARQEKLQKEQYAQQQADQAMQVLLQQAQQAKQEKEQKRQYEQQRADQQHQEQVQQAQQARQEKLQEQQQAQQRADQQHQEQVQQAQQARQEKLQEQQQAQQRADQQHQEQVQAEQYAQQRADQLAQQQQARQVLSGTSGLGTGTAGLSDASGSRSPYLGSSTGSQTVLNKDGTLTTTYTNGSTTTIDPHSGLERTTGVNGVTTAEYINRGHPVTNPDGSTTLVNGNGTVTTHWTDGSSTTFDPHNGLATTHQADGTTITNDLTSGDPLTHGLSYGGAGGGSATHQTPYEPELYDAVPYRAAAAAGSVTGMSAPGVTSTGATLPPGTSLTGTGLGAMSPLGAMGMGMGGMGGMGMGGGAGNNGERVREVFDDATDPVTGLRGGGGLGLAAEEEEAALVAATQSSYLAGGVNGQAQYGRTQSSDRDRTAWSADEDDDVWGVDEGGAPAVIGR